jgi:cysteine synthase
VATQHNSCVQEFSSGFGNTPLLASDFLFRDERRLLYAKAENLNMTGSNVGRHCIQGISEEFIPPVVNLDEMDAVFSVDGGDAISIAQKLARELGLEVGISSRKNFPGGINAQDDPGSDAVMATVFPDCNKKYLSADRVREEPTRREFLSCFFCLD